MPRLGSGQGGAHHARARQRGDQHPRLAVSPTRSGRPRRTTTRSSTTMAATTATRAPPIAATSAVLRATLTRRSSHRVVATASGSALRKRPGPAPTRRRHRPPEAGPIDPPPAWVLLGRNDHEHRSAPRPRTGHLHHLHLRDRTRATGPPRPRCGLPPAVRGAHGDRSGPVARRRPRSADRRLRGEPASGPGHDLRDHGRGCGARVLRRGAAVRPQRPGPGLDGRRGPHRLRRHGVDRRELRRLGARPVPRGAERGPAGRPGPQHPRHLELPSRDDRPDVRDDRRRHRLTRGAGPACLARLGVRRCSACLAPLGPAGFVPFLVFPLWVVLVASLVRYPEA